MPPPPHLTRTDQAGKPHFPPCGRRRSWRNMGLKFGWPGGCTPRHWKTRSWSSRQPPGCTAASTAQKPAWNSAMRRPIQPLLTGKAADNVSPWTTPAFWMVSPSKTAFRSRTGAACSAATSSPASSSATMRKAAAGRRSPPPKTACSKTTPPFMTAGASLLAGLSTVCLPAIRPKRAGQWPAATRSIACSHKTMPLRRGVDCLPRRQPALCSHKTAPPTAGPCHLERRRTAPSLKTPPLIMVEEWWMPQP